MHTRPTLPKVSTIYSILEREGGVLVISLIASLASINTDETEITATQPMNTITLNTSCEIIFAPFY